MSTALEQPAVRSLYADDPEFAEILDLFAELLPEKRDQLVVSHQAHDLDGVRVCAHQLKGAGGGYGFPNLSAAAAELEQACKTNDIDRVGQSLDQLLGYMDRIEV